MDDNKIINNIIRETDNNKLTWTRRIVPDGDVFETKYFINKNMVIELQALLCKNIRRSYLNIQIPSKKYDKTISIKDNDNIYSMLLIINLKY